MGTGIYLIQGDDRLVEMSEQPYDSEAYLQALLARYPDLLPGDQVNPGAPRSWLLVKREAAIPAEEDGAGRWSVDHLFLDQDAVPTLVEVKRGTDTRIRRQVVGQMLDYAANCVAYWPAEGLRQQFEATCAAERRDPEQALSAFLGADTDPERFWQDARTNLQAGRIRMLFVADEIPAELRRVVEFLNEQMDPAEVLAVEIRQFCGQGLRTLVPRVVGQTARKPAPPRAARQWDEASFLEDLATRHGRQLSGVVRRVLRWSRERRLREWWGRGKADGSFFPMLNVRGTSHHLIAIWSNGSVETQFQHMQFQPPFDSEELRREMCRRFNAIPGVQIPEDGLRRRPSFQIAALGDEARLAQFLEVLDWAIDQIRAGDGGGLSPDGAP